MLVVLVLAVALVTSFYSAWLLLVGAVVAGIELLRTSYFGASRWRNAVLRVAESQASHPELDQFRSLRRAWQVPAFRLALAKSALVVASILAVMWLLVVAVRLLRNAA